MKQDSLQASSDTEQPARESGIFSDLAVRQHDDTPAAKPGRSIPPPPPRTSSAILPVPQPTQFQASSANFHAAPDWEDLDVEAADAGLEPEFEVEVEFEPEFEPEQVLSPPTPRRSEAWGSASPRSVPPPPSGTPAPTVPGVSFPDSQSAGRPRSVAPGMWAVTPRVTRAAAGQGLSPLVQGPASPSEREMSGTFQREVTGRGSYAAVTQEPPLALGHGGAVIRRDLGSATHARGMDSRLLSYALLVAAVLTVGGLAGYWLSTRARPGVVQLTTEPVDAQVFFDGVAVGSVSPFLETGVTPGTKHHLEVRKDGFRSWAQQVEVPPGQTLVFTVALPRDEAAVASPTVVPPLVVERAAAPVAVPEVPTLGDVPGASASASEEVPAVSENVERRPRRASRAVSSPPMPSEPVTSPPAVSADGTLRVSSRPWSVVTIDGKVIGNTPQMNVSLPVGPHRVHLRSPEFDIEKEVSVSIRAGETETLIVNLP